MTKEEPESPGATCALREWQLSFPRGSEGRELQSGSARQDHPAAGSWHGLLKLQGQEREKCYTGTSRLEVFLKEKAVGGMRDEGWDGMGSTHLALK